MVQIIKNQAKSYDMRKPFKHLNHTIYYYYNLLFNLILLAAGVFDLKSLHTHHFLRYSSTLTHLKMIFLISQLIVRP